MTVEHCSSYFSMYWVSHFCSCTVLQTWKKTDIFRIGSWGNDLESRSRWMRTHLLVDSRTLLLVDSGALLLIDCRTLFLVDRWALLLIHCVAHLEVRDAVFSISPWETSNSVSYLLVHCVLDSATLLLLNSWTLLFIHSRALLLIDGRALLFIDSWTLLLIDSVVFCLALLLVHSVALLLLHCVANLEISVQDPVRKNKTESGAELTCSLTVEHCCSLTVEHCCSWTVLHTWMRHFLILLNLNWKETKIKIQFKLTCSLTVEHCCSFTVEHCCSWTVEHSFFCTVLHCCSFTVLHCWNIFRSILNSTKPDSHLFIHSIALLLVLSPASRRRSRSISRGCWVASPTVVLALGTPRDPLVEAEAAEETSVLGLEGERLGLDAQKAHRGTDQLQCWERSDSHIHSAADHSPHWRSSCWTLGRGAAGVALAPAWLRLVEEKCEQAIYRQEQQKGRQWALQHTAPEAQQCVLRRRDKPAAAEAPAPFPSGGARVPYYTIPYYKRGATATIGGQCVRAVRPLLLLTKGGKTSTKKNDQILDFGQALLSRDKNNHPWARDPGTLDQIE